MKNILIATSLLLGFCFFSLLISCSSTPTAELAPVDEVIKTSQKSEKKVLCVPHTNGREVFLIKDIWIVSEYKSGKIITDKHQDTLHTELLSKGTPCPGDVHELSMN